MHRDIISLIRYKPNYSIRLPAFHNARNMPRVPCKQHVASKQLHNYHWVKSVSLITLADS